MINRILGLLTGRSAESLYILTGGIEWDISVPSRASALFGTVGEQTEVFAWLHHWDEGMKLFGFPSDRERQIFLDLMKVEGIGPRQALKILSGISPADLALALENADLKALQRISGVGPKLAQKMVLALKGKLVEADRAPGAGASGARSPWEDVVTALVDMGFDRRAAEAAVTTKAETLPAVEGEGTPAGRSEREKEVFRQALLELSSGGGR
jgi:Holliday junction DNA helicase RuvA